MTSAAASSRPRRWPAAGWRPSPVRPPARPGHGPVHVGLGAPAVAPADAGRASAASAQRRLAGTVRSVSGSLANRPVAGAPLAGGCRTGPGSGTGAVGHLVAGPDGAGEASGLLLPGRAAGHQVEGVAEEPLRGGVLVEAPGQVGQSVAEVLAGRDRHVEEQRPERSATAAAWSSAMPASISMSTGAGAVGQHEGQGHVEEVVRGHSRPRPSRSAAASSRRSSRAVCRRRRSRPWSGREPEASRCSSASTFPWPGWPL